ncbi:MAG TPA: class I SAM-dependent methyltransferase [Casimicrobiaceae bacterium]|nr:class I SAM-dependent methyltransferase [Casimicrobiaceae bacterium]
MKLAAAQAGRLTPDADGRLELVERFFDGTGATYDAMVHWATLGIDRLWKKRMVAAIPAHATRVLDLACGTGISTFAIARARPECHVTGVELRDEYLQFARAKLAREPLPNVSLVLSRAEDFSSDQRFDCISSSYLAKYADLPRLVAANRAMLAPGGLLLMHDFTLPPAAALRGVWRAYFALMQQTVARIVPAWREIYYGLPRLIESTRWLEELPPLLRPHGFEDVRVEYFTLYGSALVSARKGA